MPHKYLLILLMSVLLFSEKVQAEPITFKIASYNVENLFDLNLNGSEYKEYCPNNIFGWNKQTLQIKLNNIARVIKDLGADIIALEEIESPEALNLLQHKLKSFNVDYPFSAIADSKNTTVKCALLSKFPIIEQTELSLDNPEIRNILKITVDIEGNKLILFVNHWKSKRGPESLRVASARALKRYIEKLPDDADFILLGDFNSDYNEYKTFLNNKRLNNTNGNTGINHVLGTIKDSKMITEESLINQKKSKYLYNLWLEIDRARRWSYYFFSKKNSPDSIIVSKGLYDSRGISYLDNSFDKFEPDYLFRQNKIFRWQRAKNGKGKHLGKGYSDHLPVFAYFSTSLFYFKSINHSENNNPSSATGKDKSEYLKVRLDLNTASGKELEAISGVGPVLAERIIAGRPYEKVDDLLRVKGIGRKKLEKLRNYFAVNKE